MRDTGKNETILQEDYEDAMNSKETYISQWRTNFKQFISWARNYASCALDNPFASEADKKCFTSVKGTLLGNDVSDIKHDIETASITLETFNKIEKLYNDLMDAAIDSINESEEAKLFLKGVSRKLVASAKSFGIQEADRLGLLGVNKIIDLDKLTYAGNLVNLNDI